MLNTFRLNRVLLKSVIRQCPSRMLATDRLLGTLYAPLRLAYAKPFSTASKTSEPDAKSEKQSDSGKEAEQTEQEIAAKHEKVISDLENKHLRALAEAENVRTRARKQVDEAKRYAVTKITKSFLEVADDLDRTIQNNPSPKHIKEPAYKSLHEGVILAQRKLESVLSGAKVSKIQSVDVPFDPIYHDCLFEVEDSSKPVGTVAQVVRDGYLIQDRVLRPAQVGVIRKK